MMNLYGQPPSVSVSLFWAVVGFCLHCGNPVWAQTNHQNHIKSPDVQRSCNCGMLPQLLSLLERMLSIGRTSSDAVYMDTEFLDLLDEVDKIIAKAALK